MEAKMESKQVHLKLITPMRVVFDKRVDFVIVRTRDGDMGILHGHEPYSAILDYGALRVYMNNMEDDVYTVLGGTVTVLDNEVVVLSEMAERPDKIQEAVDKLKEERAANELKEQLTDLDIHRAETAIRRVLVHMEVSAYSIIKDHGDKT